MENPSSSSYNEQYSLQVISIRDVQRHRKFGSKLKKVLDLLVSIDGKSFTLEITQKKLNKLTSEVKKELYNITLPSITINSNATNELIQLFQTITSNPKLARSNSVMKFLEKEGNKVLSIAFVGDEFMRDTNHSGPLQKMKNKHKVTKKDRICFIKYQRIMYYYTLNKECKGQICLDDCAVQKVTSTNNSTFSLATPNSGTYLFIAPSPAECDQWVNVIKQCIDFCTKSKARVAGQLTGTIVKGRNFAKKDLNGYADPFGISRIERQQIRTTTIYKTLNPTWNENFVFDITKNEGYFYLLVWDEDKYSAADFMGKILIPLTALPMGQDVMLYLPLTPKSSKNVVTGDVCVRLKYVYTLDNPPPLQSSIFGQPLQSFEARGDICTDSIPNVLFDCVKYFEQYGLKEEGIFRICGSSTEIKSLKQQMDSQTPVSFTPDRIHSIAGVFKLFFRELPEPILTFEKYESYVNSVGYSMNLKNAITLVKSLPKNNQRLLQLLLPFFHKIGSVEYSKYNMMNCSNLAIVFGPAFLRPHVETNDSILKLNVVNEITKKLIEFSPQIYDNINTSNTNTNNNNNPNNTSSNNLNVSIKSTN